jgi:hypothetical protein
MPVRALSVLVSLSMLAACGGGGPPPEPPKPISTPAPPAPTREVEPAEAVPAPAPATGRFGDSPLAPFAEELVSVVEAALAKRPLPRVAFPIERHDPEDELVRSDGPVPTGLEYIALALELELALDAGGIELLLFVSRHGVKLMGIEKGGGADRNPPPAWFPVATIADEILADLRADRLDRWWVGEPEKQLLGPALARELDKERSDPDEVEEAKQVVARGARLQGVEIDDVTLVARDARGAVYGLRMQFENGDRPELDSHPLVRVKPAPGAER